MKTGITVLVLLLTIVGSAAAQLQHDISVDSMQSLSEKYTTWSSVPLIAHVTNRGVNDESLVPIVFIVTNSANQVVYRDSFYIGSIKVGQSVDCRMTPNFTTYYTGVYTFCATNLLKSDQDQSNDKSCDAFTIYHQKDFKTISIDYPLANDSIGFRTSLSVVATFKNLAPDSVAIVARI